MASTSALRQQAPLAERCRRLPERLHSRAEYVRVQTLGRKFRGQHLMLVVNGQPTAMGSSGARVGYTVSRRVGNAVVRNRVRRILKEVVRLGAGALCPGTDYVVIAFPQAAHISSCILRQELMCLLHRALAWARPTASATAS